MEHNEPRQMLNVVVNGEYAQRELDHVQVMPRGQMSRMVPKLREGEEAHYTMGGGIVITEQQRPDPNFIVELRYDPNHEFERYIVCYADGRETQVSKELFGMYREEMEARYAK